MSCGIGGSTHSDISSKQAKRPHCAELPLQQAAEAGPGLSEVLTPEVTVPLVLSDDAALERLAPFLPEQHR